jgi:extracellular elastinolytic metalloproteinase
VRTSLGVRRILPILVGLALALPLIASNQAPAQQSDSDDAFDYVNDNAARLGVTRADVGDVFVTSKYTSSHSGITHVNLNQRFQGLEVFGGHATVNIAADGEVIFASGAFVRDLNEGASGTAKLDATEAVAAAAEGLELDQPKNLRVLSQESGASEESVLSRAGISDEPIPARLGWQPTKDGLRKAWQVTIDDSSDAHLWNAAVDVETGELLKVDDWTHEDSYESLASTLMRSSSASASAAASGPPLPPSPAVDGSSYRVFQIPREGPNDGPRTLVENPADDRFSPFGWHDINGVAGAEFTNTRGNNVHAYLDQDRNNQPDFGDADGGPGLDFDFPVDLNEHSQAYREAVVTNLFYGCNIVHDLTTLYGFNEDADNFQTINYGGGPFSNGDHVRCEAADGNGTNNANFSTPSTGGTPRMQMFLWPGNQLGSQNQVAVDGGASFGAGWARFGPPAPNAGLTGQFFDAGNGCAPADYAGAPAGDWIAIVVGGTTGCEPIEKARQADNAGASAIVMTTGTGTTPSTAIIAPNLGGMAVASPGIPAVAITEADGDALRGALPASGAVRKHPNHPGIRDGDFDFAIIGHEYGHGVSNRLTGGPGINCLSGNEQAGEGWSDYIGLTIPLDPALDDPDQPRGLVPYVLFQPDRHGNGLRPRPYTRDMTIQPFTYDSIKTNGWLANAEGNPTSLALPHGLGHGWNAVLWDMNWDLIDKHGFHANLYDGWEAGGNTRAFQYVMDGLKIQGCGPGLVVARSAIIAGADELSDGEDTCTLWATFARRGLGFGAVQGTTNRDDNTEAFDTHPDCRRGFQPPASHAYGSLRDVDAGDTVPLRFTADGYRELDVLASNSPFSRRVDCETLQVPSITPGIITPREYPIDTQTLGNSKLTVNGQGVFHYNWKTLEEWGDTCREVVVTRDDGKQHRAFFRFL